MSEVIGKVIHIGETEVVGSAGTFKKRLIVIETSEQYSQKIPVDFVQDKCDLLDKYKVGQNVTVGINIRGNEYSGKYYVSLNGWKISKENQSNPEVHHSNHPTNTPNPNQEKPKDFKPEEEELDDLPF